MFSRQRITRCKPYCWSVSLSASQWKTSSWAGRMQFLKWDLRQELIQSTRQMSTSTLITSRLKSLRPKKALDLLQPQICKSRILRTKWEFWMGEGQSHIANRNLNANIQSKMRNLVQNLQVWKTAQSFVQVQLHLHLEEAIGAIRTHSKIIADTCMLSRGLRHNRLIKQDRDQGLGQRARTLWAEALRRAKMYFRVSFFTINSAMTTRSEGTRVLGWLKYRYGTSFCRKDPVSTSMTKSYLWINT